MPTVRNVHPRYPLLEGALRTREGFVASVNARPLSQTMLIAVIVVGAEFLFIAVMVLLPFEAPWWRVLFWGQNVAAVVLSWLGALLVGVGVVGTVRLLVTKESVAHELFERFCEVGYLAELTPTNIRVSRKKGARRLYLFGSGAVSPDVVLAAMELLAARIRESRTYLFRLSRLTRGPRRCGYALTRVDETLPAGVYVCANVGFSDPSWPRVAVPGDDPTVVALYTLKRSVSVM